jgi:KaiC/GvpD/RAD55 family RecA-like ATPase
MSKAKIGLGTFYHYARKGGYDRRQSNLMALAGVPSAAPAMPLGARTDTSNLYPAYSLSELDSLPEPKWLIEDILPENSLCMVYGPSGSLKTFLVLGWALNGAAGLPWGKGELASLKGFEIARPLRVAILAGEGARGLRKRVKAWQKQNNVSDERLDVIVVPEMPSFGRVADIDRLIATIKAKLGAVDVVIVDTVMRASSGLNLNTPAESQTFIDACERIKRELGCTVVLVHHTGKDRERGHLGAENLRAAMDMMERVDLIAHRPGLRVIRLRQEKAKDSEEREEIYLIGSLEVIGKAADGSDVTSLVLDRCLKPSPQGESSKNNLRLDTALRLIRERTVSGGVSSKGLAEELVRASEEGEMSPDTFTKKVDAMRKWIEAQAREGGALHSYASVLGSGKKAARVFRCQSTPSSNSDGEGAFQAQG